jgi:ankyrin repeat protein
VSGIGMTAYDLAVNYGYQDITQLLIEKMNLIQPEVNMLDSDGNTALMRAVKAEDIDSVEAEIALGVDASIRDVHGDSPLTHAVYHDLESIISLLRQSGSERIATDIQNGDEQLVTAAESGAMGTILDLLDAGVSIETENSDGDTALTAAAGGHPGVLKVLAKLGANLSHRNNKGKTSYMIASEANRVAIIEALDEIRAPVDEHDDGDDLVAVDADIDELISAVLSGDISMVRQQLAAGVDVNCENDEGRTALIYALAALGRRDIGRREERDQEQILFMLIDAGVDPKKGSVPSLLIAAQMRKLHIVNALIRLGAEVDVKDDDSSMNSLMMAIVPSYEEQEVDEGASLAIIDAGADLSYARDDGLTAAHLAAGCGFLKTLDAIISRWPDCVNVQDGTLLLKANADKSIQNSEGETALDIALAERNQEAATALT